MEQFKKVINGGNVSLLGVATVAYFLATGESPEGALKAIAETRATASQADSAVIREVTKIQEQVVALRDRVELLTTVVIRQPGGPAEDPPPSLGTVQAPPAKVAPLPDYRPEKVPDPWVPVPAEAEPVLPVEPDATGSPD